MLAPVVSASKRRIKPSTPTYERMPVDVDHEESFVSNCLYTATLKALPDAAPTDAAEKIVFTMNTAGSMSYDFDEDMEARTPRATTITLSLACRNRAIANFVFNELEKRRQELSIYRGKVIDPVIAPGGIRTIGFKRIKGVTEADLILPQSVKSLIENSIIGFYKNQETLRALGVSLKRGILFNSRPGTGKTSISLYLAGLLPHFTICFVSGRRLLYPRELCAMARYLQPTMLVLEDIDLIATERDMNGLATVLGELMNQIDGCEPADRVLFIMNTNSMDRLEEAVKNRPGRVDQIIHIPLPDVAARKQLIRHFARNVGVDDDAVNQAASVMDGATPAMIKEVVQRAAVSAVARDGHTDTSQKLHVTAADLVLAFEQCQAMREARPLGSQVL